MELLDKLGIDWKLLLAQIVNFLIVLAVLYRWLYKPLIVFLEQRRARIDKSLQEAQRIESDLKELESKKVETMVEAKRQAQDILERADEEAERQRQETLSRVRAEAERVVAEVRAKFEAEREEARQALRREAARLVVQVVTKVVGKLPAEAVDRRLVEEAVQEVTRRKPLRQDK
ncbi:MAG: F0F1 ATP synthase subunit B [Candidatus Kerfeldbacteria bacterium]|nr:F0F1 ATP synthase subunit B [Candidatus Kerfeldbacteria bacterium]